jgi:zinc protease
MKSIWTSGAGTIGWLTLAACVQPPAAVEPKTPTTSSAAAPTDTKKESAPVAEATHGETPDAPFRSTLPPEDGELTLKAPKVETFSLKNGMKVMLVERHDLPVINVRVSIKGGHGDYPGISSGLGSSVAAMLEQGTSNRTALQISEEYEALGAQHGVFVGYDAAGGSVKVLSKHIEPALFILNDVLQHPNFPDAEIERMRTRRLTSLLSERNSSEVAANNAVLGMLYGRGHPYGLPQSGRVDEVKKMTRDDMTRAYSMIFNPKNATIVVVGDTTRAGVSAKLERTLGTWRPSKGAITSAMHAPAPPAASNGPRISWVDRPGAPQSQVEVVDIGVPEGGPDRIAISVMNTIFGGSFGHLAMNLRETHAYTYGVRSRFDRRHGAGPMVISSAVASASTAPAIQEIFREVVRMREQDVKTDELANAKEFVKQSIFSNFDTADGVSSALSNLTVYDRPLDDYATLAKRIDAVTTEDVRRVASKYLRPESLRVVVVGDRGKLEAGVVQALRIGPSEARDVYGDVAK